MKSKVLALTSAVLMTAGLSFAQAEKSANQLIQSAGKRSAQSIQAQEAHKIIQEALQAYQETQQVLILLAQGKVQEAKKLMEDIKKKLHHLKTLHQEKLAKLPISVVITEIDGVDDIKLAKEILKKAKKACQQNDIPTARDLLELLRNEIDIQTHYLPLDIYTRAVELAYQLLEKGDVKNALAALNVALGSIEIEEVIIPKPIAEALILVQDAKKVFKVNPKKAEKLLEEAKRKIKLAQVLGYIRTEKEIEPLIREIESLEKQIKKETATKSLFESLEKHIQKMQTKSTHTKERQ